MRVIRILRVDAPHVFVDGQPSLARGREVATAQVCAAKHTICRSCPRVDTRSRGTIMQPRALGQSHGDGRAACPGFLGPTFCS